MSSCQEVDNARLSSAVFRPGDTPLFQNMRKNVRAWHAVYAARDRQKSPPPRSNSGRRTLLSAGAYESGGCRGRSIRPGRPGSLFSAAAAAGYDVRSSSFDGATKAYCGSAGRRPRRRSRSCMSRRRRRRDGCRRRWLPRSRRDRRDGRGEGGEGGHARGAAPRARRDRRRRIRTGPPRRRRRAPRGARMFTARRPSSILLAGACRAWRRSRVESPRPR